MKILFNRLLRPVKVVNSVIISKYIHMLLIEENICKIVKFTCLPHLTQKCKNIIM